MSNKRGAIAPVKGQRWLTVLTAVLVASIALLAFVLSFEALRDLAVRCGVPVATAWAFPVIVDGSIVAAMLAIFSGRSRRRKDTTWAWVSFLFFAAVSVVSNGVHTAVIHDASQGIAMWFAIGVGAVPPLALLLSSEVLVRLLPSAADTDATLVDTEATLSQEPVVAVAVAAAVPVVADTDRWPVVAVAEPVVAAVGDPDTGSWPVADTDASLGTPEIPGFLPVAEPVFIEREEVTPAEPVAIDATPDVAADSENDTVATEIEVVAATVAEVAPATRLHAVESVPTDPAGQVGWIVSRAKAGRDVKGETLSRLFQEAGQSVSERTIQRRIAAARELAPDVLEAAG